MDGPDYRHRGLPEPPPPLSADEVRRRADGRGTASGQPRRFDALCAKLARLHPSTYGRLLDGACGRRCLRLGVRPAPDQAVALRLVTLIDRLYDRSVPVQASGGSLGELFTPEMLRGGYRKKYLRATSRVLALSREDPA